MTLYLTRDQWVDFQDFLGLPDPPTEEECEERRKREDAIVFALLDKASKDIDALEPKPFTLADLANLLGIIEK